MVSKPATDSDSRRGKNRIGRRAPPRGEAASASGASRRPRTTAPRVKARDAGRRIRAAADASDVLEVRGRLRTLARQVARSPGNVRSVTRIETVIGACLDEAASCESPRERWLLDEAATWAIAWLASARRAGVTAGSLLDRILAEGARADHVLADGDTAPARFLLVLTRLFREPEACRRYAEHVSTGLTKEIESLVTSEGAVMLPGSIALVGRVAHWTECRDVALATGGLPWDDDTERAWAAAVATAARLLGTRGRMLAGSGQLPAAASASLLEAIENAGRGKGAGSRFPKPLRRAARRLSRRPREEDGGRLPAADFHDATAGLTIIRSGWGGPGESVAGLRVLVDHREHTPWLEIAVADRLLVAGPWQFRVRVGGRDRTLQGPWTVAAWESDRTASFLEITAPLGDGMRFDRHVVVLPQAGIVLAADAIVARPPTDDGGADHSAVHAGNGAARTDDIEYVGTIPLAAALDAEPAAETREIVLYDTTTRGMALPLGLNEWRTGAGGSFEAEGGLTLAQTGHGRLYAPVWFDCDASRVGGPLTWRQLTVADTRRILPAWQAVGYRVQAGDEQWLVYRTLDAARNRTVLGCNVSCDFLVGRIRPRGMVSRILEIV